MKSIKTMLVLLMAIVICNPTFGQKGSSKSVKAYKSQDQLALAIVNELKSNFGPRSITSLKRLKTKKEFVGYLKANVTKCKSCPLTKEFSGKLAVVNEKFEMQGKLTYGTFLVNSAQNEEGTDPDEDAPEPPEDPDTDEPETEPSDGGGCPPCGPLTCLSYWGQHIPCCDMPSY